MEIKNYLKSFVSFSIGIWIRAIISFISTPIITYLIVPEEFGRATMYSLVYSIVLEVSKLGLDESYLRYYHEKNNKNAVFINTQIPALILSTAISVIFLILERQISVLLYGSYYKGISILFMLSLITAVLQRFNELSVRMQKRGILFSAVQVTNSIGNVLGTISYAYFINSDFYAVIVGQISGNVASLILGHIRDRSSRKLAKLRLNEVKEYLAYGLPFLPALLVYWFFTAVDRISLRQYTNFEEIGLYSAAFKIVSVMNLIQNGFTSYWIPLAYERYEKDSENKEFFRKANLAVSFVLFSFGMLVLSVKDIMFLILAKTYREASYIAPFLILAPVLDTLSHTTKLGINFKKKTYWHLVVASISALANYIGNTLLVPVLGAKGAAISTGLSYILYFMARTLIAERLYPVGFKLNKILLGIITTIAVAYVGTFYRSIKLNMIAGAVGIISIMLIYKDEIKWVTKNREKLLK
ncbi:oligosaccharide flippase family protein [Fervidobacterium sp.]